MKLEENDTSIGFSPGAIIAGKYRVVRHVASGGVGAIALATHIDSGHRVAIKYLRPGRASDAMIVERFKREGRLAARLCSEHVVRVHELGALESGAPYMVMEYLEGEDLSGVLGRYGPPSIDAAVRWTMEACRALVEAHALVAASSPPLAAVSVLPSAAADAGSPVNRPAF